MYLLILLKNNNKFNSMANVIKNICLQHGLTYTMYMHEYNSQHDEYVV